MKKTWLFTFPMLFLATVSTCRSSMETPDIKQYPHPKMRYEITMLIKDAPGPFDAVTGFMQYDVTNEQCAPFKKFIGIYRTPPSQSPPISFTRISDVEYRGTLYLDLLQDEDYYGFGTCHWSMVAAIVRLKFQEVTFSPYLLQERILSQQPTTMFFPKRGYGDNSIKDMSYNGTTMSDTVARYRDEFFSVTLSVKERFE